MRATVISLYTKLKLHLSGKTGSSRSGDETDEDEIDQVPDFFLIEYEGLGSVTTMNLEDKLYILKKALILEEWKKRRMMIERKERTMNNTSRSGTASTQGLQTSKQIS